MQKTLTALPSHTSLWQTIESLTHRQRLAHAYLLFGDLETAVRPFVNRWIAMQMCEGVSAPCEDCLPCKRLIANTHPDLYRIQPEESGVIKVESIRALSDVVYQTSQCGQYRCIVIEAAETLNTFAANALLKVLEEPPARVRFFILAKAGSSLPATLMSRCQRYAVPDVACVSVYAKITLQPEWMQSFQALLIGSMTPWVLAEKWSKQTLQEVVDWLYLVTAAVFRAARTHQYANAWIKDIVNTRTTETWMKQLDRIQETSKLLLRQVNLNASLTLNYLLMGFCDAD